jgi:biopolymer transport protein ExbB
METILEYTRQGGFFMYPIIIGSLWAMTILIERFIFFIQLGSNLTKQSESFFSALYKDKPDEAMSLIKNKKGVLKNMLCIAIENKNLPPQRIEEKMDAILLSELPLYTRYFNLLAALSGLMPVLGLLGTVTGMISTFKVISLHGTGDAQAMAGGIAEALITTQAGLVAAAPMILGHVLLTNRLKKITDKTREASTRVIDYLKDHHA